MTVSESSLATTGWKTNSKFFAASALVRPRLESQEGDGFATITGGSDVGAVDLHDRRAPGAFALGP